MKKLFTLFAAALVMLAASSCEKNEVLPEGNTEGKVVTLKASITNRETKTALGEKDGDTYPVLWSEGDAIAVIQTKNVEIEGEETTITKVFKFVLQGDGNTTEGVFQLEEYEECGYSSSDFDASKEIKAFYPFEWVVSGAKCNIPTTQTYAENSFANGASPMAAYRAAGNNEALDFQNLFGALKLQIKGMEGEKVQSIEIRSSDNIAGEASFTVEQTEGGNQEYGLRVDSVEGTSCVTLDCENDNGGVSIQEFTNFLIALHPNANWLHIRIYTNKAVYYRTIYRQTIFTAGTILKMPKLENMAPAYIDENDNYQGDGIALPKGDGTNIVWAPVNCGYEAPRVEEDITIDKGYPYGKLYQWGRKYGQGYDSNDYAYPTGECLADAPVSLEQGQSRENENLFYKVSSFTDYNWLDPTNDQLWNSGNEDFPVKTGYDPCPDGWRVPTKSELTSLKDGNKIMNETFYNQKGAWFYGMIDGEPTESSPKLFLPFAGYRHKLEAVAKERNLYGYYWSSTSGTSSQSYEMDFNSSYITISTTARAHGYSVRCVKDTPQSEPMPSGN